jgi:branched-chain amino acid transport system ATP-binding protein
MARAFADRAVQMLAIARVLIGVPRLLLVDEPSEGLAPMMVTEIYAILSELNGRAAPSCWSSRTSRRR